MTRAELASLVVLAGRETPVGGLLPMASALGHVVRAARRLRGWSQDELAAEAGLHRPVIGRIEAGRHAPTLGTLCALSAALELPLSELISHAEQAQAFHAECSP